MKEKPRYDRYLEVEREIKQIVIFMNDMTDDYFIYKYQNDIKFNKGFDALVSAIANKFD